MDDQEGLSSPGSPLFFTHLVFIFFYIFHMYDSNHLQSKTYYEKHCNIIHLNNTYYKLYNE